MLTALVLSLLFMYSSAQRKTAFVSGKVIDENENPLAKASVVLLGKTTGAVTNDSGYFRIKVPADKSFALIFSHTGYAETQKDFFLNENEEEKITLQCFSGAFHLKGYFFFFIFIQKKILLRFSIPGMRKYECE